MLLKEYPIMDNTQSVADYAETVAEAQLKKVVEWLYNECYGNPDELGYMRLEGDIWQSLLEEIE